MNEQIKQQVALVQSLKISKEVKAILLRDWKKVIHESR